MLSHPPLETVPPSPSEIRKHLSLTRHSTLLDLENILKTLRTESAPTTISLPSDNRAIFLRDLRIAAVISATYKMSNVECRWRKNISAETHKSLIGLAGAVYGVLTEEGDKFPSLKEAKWKLSQRNDILENPPGSKETLTFCAIDEETRSQPLALAGFPDKANFIALFERFVLEYFDKGNSKIFFSRISPNLFDFGNSVADQIYGFVYELYQNTFNHGSLNENQKTIPGLRIIRLRKRISTPKARNAFIEGANGFLELKEYFQKVAPSDKSFKFYEISISDNGMGIVSRYRSVTGTDIGIKPTVSGNLDLLNRIVSESLSSDTKKSEIGEGGLKKALRAVDRIQGFVSLRSDNLWVFRNPNDSDNLSDNEWLKPVASSKELAPIPGTHFSIIVLAS